MLHGMFAPVVLPKKPSTVTFPISLTPWNLALLDLVDMEKVPSGKLT